MERRHSRETHRQFRRRRFRSSGFLPGKFDGIEFADPQERYGNYSEEEWHDMRSAAGLLPQGKTGTFGYTGKDGKWHEQSPTMIGKTRDWLSRRMRSTVTALKWWGREGSNR